jgi:hypothetical protein
MPFKGAFPPLTESQSEQYNKGAVPDVLVNDAAVLRFCPNLRCNRPLGVRMHIEHEDEETVGWRGSCAGCGREFTMTADKVQWESSDGRVPAGD